MAGKDTEVAALQQQVQHERGKQEQAQQELVLAQQRHGREERQKEDLVRLLEAAAALEDKLRSEVHAIDTARRQEQAGKEDALQAFRKEVIRREELEAQLLSMVAKERAAAQQRQEAAREEDVKRQEAAAAVQREQERAVRADARANALLDKVKTLEEEVDTHRRRASEAQQQQQHLQAMMEQAEVSVRAKDRDLTSLRSQHEQQQAKMSAMERSLALEQFRAQGKDHSAEQAREHLSMLEGKVAKGEEERASLLALVKKLELEVMERHTEVSMAETAAALAHQRQVAAEEAAAKCSQEQHQQHRILLQQQAAAEERVRASKEEVEKVQARARQEIAAREAETEALIAAARDEMMRQLDQEAKRRLDMANGADALLERNAELETRLQDQVHKSMHLTHTPYSLCNTRHATREFTKPMHECPHRKPKP